MSSITPLLFMVALVLFALGVLTGNSAITRNQDARDRRQAAVQRDLNLQFLVLREQQEAAEEEMRWLSKQQAGLVVIDYDATKKADTNTQVLHWSARSAR